MNGKTGEVLRWAIGLALAALVAHYTAVARISVMEEREENHYGEVMRKLERIERKIDYENNR
jgi:demethoxyubiquinone hydroxylase (CLK1/Coq7/Cat5 family)